VIECLPSNCEALSSNPSTIKKKLYDRNSVNILKINELYNLDVLTVWYIYIYIYIYIYKI
jgi:hypothetical protein